MNIQKKMILLTIAAGMSIYLTSQIIFITQVTGLTEEMKNEQSDHDIYMLDLELTELTTQLSKTVNDWAVWEDMYQFVTGSKSDFLVWNIKEETFSNLDLTGIIIIDKDKNILYENYFDLRTQEYMNISESERTAIHDMVFSQSGMTVSGMLDTGQRILIYAGNNILAGDRTTNSDGYMFMFKTLDGTVTRQIKEHLVYPTKFEMTDETIEERYPEAKKIKENTYRLDMEEAHYLTLSHIYDNDYRNIGIVEIDTNWHLYDKAENMRKMIILSMFSITIITCILFYILSDRYLIKRIRKIDKTISEIIATNNLRKKVDDNDTDEIGHLARNFNRMTTRIHEKETEIKEKNIELENSNKKLKRLDRMKDELISSVSHELRTPLTGIKSYVQLMQDETLGPVTRDQKEALDTIYSCSEDLNKIVTRILDIKKYETNEMQLTLERCDIRTNIEEVCKEYEAKINIVNGKTTFDDKTQDPYIKADRTKINEVLRNLISNSIKYRSKKDLTIDMILREDSKSIILSISDNGIGIEQDKQKYIFQKFYQVDQGMDRKVSGSGLGLYLVKEIIEAHKGTIEVSGNPRKGTTFTIKLPRYRE